MEHEAWLKSINLNHELLSGIKNYNLFQIFRILENYYHEYDLLRSDIQTIPIYFHAAAELAFPETDIKSINIDGNNYLHIFMNYCGLYGVDSPLPQYWLDKIAIETESSSVIRAFLDIFHQRLYVLLYLSWKKFQPTILIEQSKPGYLNYLQSISGQLLQACDNKEYAFAGVLGQRVHNAETLRSILTNYFDNITVTVNQFVLRWVNINHELCLSSNRYSEMKLADNATLGRRVIDATESILIILGPISFTRALKLLKEQTERNKLWHIIRLYVGNLYHIKIVLNVFFDQPSNLSLGGDEIYLAWCSCLGMVNGNLFVTLNKEG